MPMFIEVLLKFLWRLWSSGLFNLILDLHQLGVAVSRRCDKLPESGETCEDISDEGGVGVKIRIFKDANI